MRASFLRLWRQALYGTGPRAIKVGKHIRYRTSDVEQWLEDLALA